MAVRLASGKPLELTKTRYGVGISWDKVRRTVDLDLQAILVNNHGTIIDAVYYNKLEAMDRAVAHSGDEQSGAAEGLDETIWVNLSKLSEEVKLIIFVLAASTGGDLCDAGDVCVHLVEKYHSNKLDAFSVQKSIGRVLVIAVMGRSPDGAWNITKMDEVAEEGGHFMDILEPTLGNIIRRRVRNAPKVQRVNFPMRKGAAVEMAQCASLKNVTVSVGWDIGGMSVDLDVSAVFFDKEAKNVGAVYYENKRQCGVVHTGDNQTGEGEGDDETINVDLMKVPGHILQIFFVVNIYTKDVTFDTLKNAYVRISDSHGQEMLRFDINDRCRSNSHGSGLVISRFCRSSPTGRWNFQAMGVFCPGRKWMDASCMREMQSMCRKSPKELERDLAKIEKEIAKQVKKTAGPTIKDSGPSSVTGRSSLKLERAASGLEHSSDLMKSVFKRRCQPSFMAPISEMWFRKPSKSGSGSGSKILVGVGWDVSAQSGMVADFDVSAVIFHTDGRDLGAVDYENPQDYGLLHSGDNQTGEGDGDDETITVDLEQIPTEVAQIFLVVTVYTKGMTFGMVENAYCRVVGGDGNEMCHYDLTDASAHKSATALVLAQFYRHPELGWVFKARGSFCTGRTWLDPSCIDKMKQIYKRTLDDLNPGPIAPQPPDAAKPVSWRRSTTQQNVLGCEPHQGLGGEESPDITREQRGILSL